MGEGRVIADTLRVGDRVGEAIVRVTDAMVDAYAAAVGDFNPLFMEKDGTGCRIAHPELLPKYAMDALWVPLFDRMPNIRAKQTYTFVAPVRTGETYTAVGRVADKYEKRGRLFVVFEAIFIDKRGHEVLRDRRTQLVLSETVTIKQ
jgi:acyl dehydratase